MSSPTKRRICWPEPDATCLEGGCMDCNHHPFRALSVIERYARRAGVVPNRGTGEQPALGAYQTGIDNLWYDRVDYYS